MTENAGASNSLIRLVRQEMAAVGLNAREAYRLLPKWCHEAIEQGEGLFEVKGCIARHFGLDIGADGGLLRRPMPSACFKTRKGGSEDAVASTRAAMTAVARIIAHATKTPWSGTFPDAATLRAAALSGQGKPWIGLAELLDACWSHGVPVVYLPDAPTNDQKIDGMVTFTGDRPVIVMTKKQKPPAWSLFLLAHEMAHLALGHLPLSEGGAVIDQKVWEDDAGGDDQESAAHGYAVELLTGGLDAMSGLSAAITAEGLAASALQYGGKNQIDPGYLILNAINQLTAPDGKRPWSLANTALQLIDQNTPTSKICQDHAGRYLDETKLSHDSSEFIERLGLL